MVVGSTRTPKSVPALVLVATVALQCRVDDSGNYTFGAAVEEAGEAGDAGDAATSGASGHVGVGGRGGASGGSGGSTGSSASGGALAGGRGGASGASGGALSGEAGDAGSMDPPGSAGGSGGAGEGGDGDGEGGAGGAPDPGMGGTSTGGAPANCTMFCLPLGAECASPNECESGRCVDGVCCESTCNGECQACRGDLTGAADGVCEAVLPNTDPDGDCEEEAASSCGQTGLCDGKGGCALYEAGTVCADATCTGGVEYGTRTCDGLGDCGPASSAECAPYLCGKASCETTCKANAECAGDAVCVGGACREPSALLEPCDELADCARGECIDNRCALTLESLRITGEEVPGGGHPQYLLRGWWSSDENGRNLERVSNIDDLLRLWNSMDITSHFTPNLPPDTYLLLTGQEDSEPLTRRFQFDLSDGTSVVKDVEASGTADIVCSELPEDDYVLFHFTGADVKVLRKKY